MNIGINGYEANVKNRVGSNAYAYQVLLQLYAKAREDDIEIFLPSAPLPDMPITRKGWVYRVISPAKFWTLWRLPLALYVGLLRRKRFDVFYSLGHYAPQCCPFQSVVSIMDLAYEKFPQFFKKSDVVKLKAWTRASVTRAAHVIAISEHTKNDLVTIYRKPTNQITVAYPGIEEQSFIGSTERTLAHLHIQEPYLVYVGTLQPRKNLSRLIHAFEQVSKKKKYHDLHLVIAGKIGWMADDLMKAMQQSSVKHHIRLLGFVTDEQKLALYRHAVASVLVGLYEGFGIPPLESMLAGTIPIVSNTASLPEVVGDTGVLVDPYSIDDIARGIEEVLEYTPRQREEMVMKAKVQATRYSWEKTGQSILDVLHTVGGA